MPPSRAPPVVRAALGQSLHVTFWAVFLIAVATLLLAVLVPRIALSKGAPQAMAE